MFHLFQLKGTAVRTSRATDRIAALDGLRGVAALAVVLVHFVATNPNFPPGLLKSITAFGAQGVSVFFVISGLIIPYSLSQAGYRLSDYPVFIYKRVARLDPPYLVSIMVVILLWCAYQLKPSFAGHSPFEDPLGLLLHLGYLNAFAGRAWLNNVYWTLAIEFQYYVGVGLIFPLLAGGRRAVRLAAILVLCCLAVVIPADQLIFKYIPLFVIGIALFQQRTGIIGLRECFVIVASMTLLTAYTLNLPAAVAGLFAVVITSFTEPRSRGLLFSGKISYSLYLLHAPLGSAVFRAGQLLGLWYGLSFLLALAVSVSSAWLLYLLVEKPSQRYSSRFKYKRVDPTYTPAYEDGQVMVTAFK